jgi:hypothetical protein
MTSKTFDLVGPYALLGKLYSDVQDLSEAPAWNSSLRAYRSIDCFLTLWHLADWFWVALRKDKYAFDQWKMADPEAREINDPNELKEWLCQKSVAMRVAQQVATASKHVRVQHEDVGVVAEIDLGENGSPLDVVVRIDGHSVHVELIVSQGRDFWRQLLDQALPESHFFPGDTSSRRP